jgi:hypothetical protein
MTSEAIGYGVPPSPTSGSAASTPGEGFQEPHLAFSAPDRPAVHAFFDAAVAGSGEVLDEPRLWPEYHDTYYAAFVRDPTATTWRPSAACRSRRAPRGPAA